MSGPPPPAGLVARLRTAGCVYAEDEAALLAEAAVDPDHLEALVTRRVSGTPLEQVLGWADFCGLRVVVTPTVFVPRSRTGLLVRVAVEVAPRGAVVVDLGCGSGAIGAAVRAARPDLEVHAADVDPAAVACARRNLPADRVHHGDLYAALPDTLRGEIAVLAVNAPYVPTAAIATMPPEARDHEARVALDGGEDGLDVQRRVISGASDWLRDGGSLAVETSEDQARWTTALMAAAGFRAQVRRDPDLDATVALGTRPEGGSAPTPPAVWQGPRTSP